MDEMGSATRVLVVEDEFLISAMVADMLAEHGCEVHIAANAKDALEPAAHRVTYCSPTSICPAGAALAQLARQLRPGLPVVYASGMISAIEQLNAVSGSTFVPKPYDPGKVCVLLQQFAARH